MISAWASSNQLILGQLKTEEKSNEITAIPYLLKLLDLSGCIITIDAMGTQKKNSKGHNRTKKRLHSGFEKKPQNALRRDNPFF